MLPAAMRLLLRSGGMKVRLKVSLAVVSALAAGPIAAAAATPNSSIVAGQSIAGVKLGGTEAQVRAAFGKPDFISDSTWYYFPGHATSGEALFSFFFNRGHVGMMLTTSTKERTSKHVGPGSTIAAVRKAYPKAKCASPPAGGLQCVLYGRYRGRQVETEFDSDISRKHVHTISVLYVGD